MIEECIISDLICINVMHQNSYYYTKAMILQIMPLGWCNFTCNMCTRFEVVYSLNLNERVQWITHLSWTTYFRRTEIRLGLYNNARATFTSTTTISFDKRTSFYLPFNVCDSSLNAWRTVCTNLVQSSFKSMLYRIWIFQFQIKCICIMHVDVCSMATTSNTARKTERCIMRSSCLKTFGRNWTRSAHEYTQTPRQHRQSQSILFNWRLSSTLKNHHPQAKTPEAPWQLLATPYITARMHFQY